MASDARRYGTQLIKDMLSPQLNDILTLAVAIASPILGFVVFRENRRLKRLANEKDLRVKEIEVEELRFHGEVHIRIPEGDPTSIDEIEHDFDVRKKEAEIEHLKKILDKNDQ